MNRSSNIKNCVKLFVILLLFYSCKNEIKETANKKERETQRVDTIETAQTVYKDYTTAPVDFLDEKYKINGLEFPGISPDYPSYHFFDENLGLFSVNYVGKSRLTQYYWDTSNSDGFFAHFRPENPEEEDPKLMEKQADEIIKKGLNDYYLVVDFSPKEALTRTKEGNIQSKKDAYTYYYVYENNKWIFIKRLFTSDIHKEGILLFTDLLLSHKLKDIKPISKEFQGKFTAETDGEYTTEGRGHTTYYFTITENKIDLRSEAFMGDFVCEGEYKGIQNNNILELYYDRKDDRCLKLEPMYLIKKEDNHFFIKGIGGEGTINDWVKMEKTN